jgi:WD40 repeat protein
MLAAPHNKPYLLYWNLKSKTQASLQSKVNLPGFVNCLTTSNCGRYIAVGIDEKVQILQAHTGKLIAVINKHLQNLSCIKFAANDKYLITSSDDTLILVWDFYDLLGPEKEYIKPAFTWDNHSMKINDIYVSHLSERVISASADQTCKFWNLNTETLGNTHNIIFQVAPNRCILDNLETNLYVGLVNGCILCIPIKSILHDSNKLIAESENRSFIGHKQKINCLSISLDDFTMASGSEDKTIRIWDTYSKQCIKIIDHTGPVTNLKFKHRTFFFNDEPNIVPALFSRYTIDSITNGEVEESIITKIKNNRQHQTSLKDFIENCSTDENGQDEYFELKCKHENIKKINEKIYNFAIEKIFNS